ncbi:MAG: hypothetical protein ABIZ50_04545 [Solirubrobacterales bacterium]
MSSEDRPNPDQGAEPPVEDLADEAAERNPDEETRREALELDLQERGRSEEGEDVGDAME